MSIFRTLHRSILVFFAVVTVSIVTLVHFSASKIVAEQSRKQQQSLSPAFTLLIDQLLEPLHVSQTLAKTDDVRQLLLSEELDDESILSMLAELQQKFGLYFFIASEAKRLQLNSDGTSIQLLEDEVDWYFKYKDREENIIADIGKWEHTHLYIDLRILNDQGQFVGFFGVGIPLDSFLDVFSDYKRLYGYDFIFLDQGNNITLSSDPQLNAKDSVFKTLGDLHWYQQIDKDRLVEGSLNNEIVQFEGTDALIAELSVTPFNWTLYLITPLQQRQTEISRTFVVSVIILLIVIFALFILIYNLLYNFKQDIQKGMQSDPLTNLPNRNKVELKYEEFLDAHRSVSLLLIDVDHFKTINETHGFSAGNNILKQLAKLLQSELREDDIVGRWGGEEFIVLLPDTSPDKAFDVAQKLRERMASMTASTGSMSVKITVSVGVSFTDSSRPMRDVMSHADDALYRAKRDGRNLVRVQLIDAA